LVGRYSSVGWTWPAKWFVPWWWEDLSPPAQLWTNEVHIEQWGNAYYEGYLDDGTSQAFHCIQWQQGKETDPGYCQNAKKALEAFELQTAENPSQTTRILTK
jgi:hypothetical protein